MKINNQAAMMIEYSGFKSPAPAKGPVRSNSGNLNGKLKETALIISAPGKGTRNDFSHRGQYVDLFV